MHCINIVPDCTLCWALQAALTKIGMLEDMDVQLRSQLEKIIVQRNQLSGEKAARDIEVCALYVQQLKIALHAVMSLLRILPYLFCRYLFGCSGVTVTTYLTNTGDHLCREDTAQ